MELEQPSSKSVHKREMGHFNPYVNGCQHVDIINHYRNCSCSDAAHISMHTYTHIPQVYVCKYHDNYTHIPQSYVYLMITRDNHWIA